MSGKRKFAVRRALTRALRVAHRMGYRWARTPHLAVLPAVLQWDAQRGQVIGLGIDVWLDGVGPVWTNRADGDQPMWGKCKCASCKARTSAPAAEQDIAVAVCEHPPEMRMRRDEDDWVCDGCGTWFDGATGTLIGHDDGPPDSF